MAEWTLENILGIQRGTYRPELEQKQGEFNFLDQRYKELGTHSYVIKVKDTKRKLEDAIAGARAHNTIQGFSLSEYGRRQNAKKAIMYREEMGKLFASKEKPIYEQYEQTEKQRSVAGQRLRELKQMESQDQTEKQYLESQKINGERIEDVVSFYNKKVDEYNKMSLSNKNSGEGKALKSSTEKLGKKIDYYASIYNEYDTPQLGNVKRTFKDVRIADRMFREQKARKMAEIAGIKDPVEQKLVMERDLPYFEGTGKQLKDFKKLVNIDTKNQLEELGAGNQGMIGAPEAPASTPTGTMRVPFSQQMPFNEAKSLPYDPMSRFENYFKSGNNDYGFNTKGMYGFGKQKRRNDYGW